MCVCRTLTPARLPAGLVCVRVCDCKRMHMPASPPVCQRVCVCVCSWRALIPACPPASLVCVYVCSVRTHARPPAQGVCMCACAAGAHASRPPSPVCVCVARARVCAARAHASRPARPQGSPLRTPGQGPPASAPPPGARPAVSIGTATAPRPFQQRPPCEHAQWKALVWLGSRFPVSGMRDSGEIPMS